MIKKSNLRRQWFFSEKPGDNAIELWDKTLLVWISLDPIPGGKIVVQVYDFEKLIRYLVARGPEGVYEGTCTPIVNSPDSYKLGEVTDARWFALEDKDEVIMLLEKAKSMRTLPFPIPHDEYWQKVQDLLKDLDIINSGELFISR